MDVQTLLPPLLSPVLIIGGALLILQVWRRRKTIVKQRLALVSPDQDGLDSVSETADLAGEALLRISGGDLRGADLAEIGRIFARFGIGARRLQVAFAATRLGSGAVLGLITLLMLSLVGRSGGFGALIPLVVAPLAIMAGWVMPLFVVRRRSRRRAIMASAGLPEALELLVICVEAGLSLEDGLDRVVVELHRTQPFLADELQLTAADLKILPDRDQAFANLVERVDAPSIRSVVTTLSQTLRYGTPMSAALRVAASELRNDQLVAVEERANRLPTIMTVPMMLFIMPTIFLVVGGPAVLRLLDALTP